MGIKIKNIRAICTAPEGIPLVVVKIETDQPGLYGLGCATYTQRFLTVAHAINEYMHPLLKGYDPSRIEDIWQMTMVSPYWRNSPVLNNALSGVDMALWDIKGKLANMPVYELFGGKVREGVRVYRHADGSSLEEVGDSAQALIEEGTQVVRLQFGGYGGKASLPAKPIGAVDGNYYDPVKYQKNVINLFEAMRKRFGFDIEFCHDVHERLEPIDAIRFAKELEPYRLFFLEDALAPEQVDWFDHMRNHTHIPLAMGELFTHPIEWRSIIANRQIDFIRCHISAIGGLTPARKLALFCEPFSVRTAWHGPGDVSPIGHVANIHLDLSSWNFGIQEWTALGERSHEVFPGCPELKDGYVYANDKPGLGIDIDEVAAEKYPCENILPTWTNARRPDGTLARP